MNKTGRAHMRVGIFTSTEVQVEAAEGEWMRDEELSTTPITVKINDFLAQSSSQVTFVSPPKIDLVAVSEDEDRRTYLTSVSIIYAPQEAVYDGTNADDFQQSHPKLLAELIGGMTSPELLQSIPPDIAEKIISAVTPPTGQVKEQNDRTKTRKRKAKRKKQASPKSKETRVVDGDVPIRRKSKLRTVPKLPRSG